LFWLKGAFIQLGVDQALVEVLCELKAHPPPEANPDLRLWHSQTAPLIAKQHTLAFLSFFKPLSRPCHLAGYNAADLGLLSGSGTTYQAYTIEAHLRELTQAHLGAPWGQALAQRYWQTWYRNSTNANRHVFYLDAHEKLLWTRQPVAKGFVSARHEVQACLKQFYLHGWDGHILYCETLSGDAHLSQQLIPIIEHFEQALGRAVVHVIVADREGLSADVLVELQQRKKALITLLKSNQYTGEADFVRRGQFRPVRDPRTGLVTHRVADADFWLTSDLRVRCGLLYDVDHPDRLIVVVTTLSRQRAPDIRQVVQWYLARWDIQENSFRALEAFGPLDLNFGVNRKQAVPNRPVLARLAELTPHLRALAHKLERKQEQRESQHQQIEQQLVRYGEKMTLWLRRRIRWQAQAHPERLVELQEQIAEYQKRHQKRLSRYLTRERELENQIEAHRQEQTRVLARIAELDPQAPFFEVNTETDHLVTLLRIAVYNSALFAREHYFGRAYRRATPLTLWRLFFNQDGYYREDATGIYVTLKPFRDPKVQHVAQEACVRFNDEQIRAVTGHLIHMAVIDCN
jgi:hypothetical protein